MSSFIYKFSLTCGLYHHCRVSGRVCHGYDGTGGWLVWGSLRPGLCTFSQCSNGKFSIYMHMLCVRTCVSVITTSLSVPVSTHHCRIVKVAYSGPRQVPLYLQMPCIPHRQFSPIPSKIRKPSERVHMFT